MTDVKQSPNLCKLHSFYENTTEEFFDETDIDSYFYHNIFDISQFQHRLVRVRKSSNKQSFFLQVVPILLFKDTASLYPTRLGEHIQKKAHFF